MPNLAALNAGSGPHTIAQMAAIALLDGMSKEETEAISYAAKTLRLSPDQQQRIVHGVGRVVKAWRRYPSRIVTEVRTLTPLVVR